MTNETLRSLIPSFITRIRVLATRALALVMLLKKSAPEDLSVSQRKRLEELEAAAKIVDAAVGERDRGNAAAIQPLRIAFAAAWGALFQRIESAEGLDASFSNHGERAAALKPRVFPDGREFTRLAAVDAWSYARRILQRIDEERLITEVEEIAGAQYLQNARSATKSLGEPLGLGDSVRKYGSASAVSVAMDEFTTAMVAYTRSLAADVNEKDEQSCRRFLDAVAPIDQFRVAYGAAERDELADPTQEPVTPGNPTTPVVSVTPIPVPIVAPVRPLVSGPFVDEPDAE